MTTPNDKWPILIELTFPAAQQDLWEKWTTKEGIESWWGPKGITSKVSTLEFQVGGLLEIVMLLIDSDASHRFRRRGKLHSRGRSREDHLHRNHSNDVHLLYG